MWSHAPSGRPPGLHFVRFALITHASGTAFALQPPPQLFHAQPRHFHRQPVCHPDGCAFAVQPLQARVHRQARVHCQACVHRQAQVPSNPPPQLQARVSSSLSTLAMQDPIETPLPSVPPNRPSCRAMTSTRQVRFAPAEFTSTRLTPQSTSSTLPTISAEHDNEYEIEDKEIEMQCAIAASLGVNNATFSSSSSSSCGLPCSSPPALPVHDLFAETVPKKPSFEKDLTTTFPCGLHRYDIDQDAQRISAVSQRLIDEGKVMKVMNDKEDKKDKKDKNIDAINAIYAVFHGAVVASITAIYEKHNPTKLWDMERLFRKYAGREKELYEAVSLKYEGQDRGFAGGSSVGMK